MTFDFNNLFSALQNRLRPHAVLALSFTGEHITARLVREGEPDEPERFRLPLSEATLLEAPQQAGAELAAALDQAGLHEHRAVVCLPPSWALSTSADLPQVAPEDLRSYFELRAEREFSTADLRLGHSTWSLPDGQQRATLAALPSKRAEAVEQCLATAGLRLVSLSLALGDCLSAAAPTLHLLARAANHTDAILTAGGGIALLRPLGGGSNPATLSRELRISLGRLPEALQSHVRHARLTGPHAAGLRAVLEQMAFESIVEAPGDPDRNAATAARQFLRGEPVPFEFLLPEPDRWPTQLRHLQRFNTHSGRRIATAAAALLGLLLATFLWRSHTESRLNAEWDGMKNRVAELDTLQQKIRQFRPWFEPAPQKLTALKTLISAFPERGDVWTRSVQLAADKPDPATHTPASPDTVIVAVSGFARNNATLMAFEDNLRKQPGISDLQPKQIRGNNPLQFSLTLKWQPKHD